MATLSSRHGPILKALVGKNLLSAFRNEIELKKIEKATQVEIWPIKGHHYI